MNIYLKDIKTCWKAKQDHWKKNIACRNNQNLSSTNYLPNHSNHVPNGGPTKRECVAQL